MAQIDKKLLSVFVLGSGTIREVPEISLKIIPLFSKTLLKVFIGIIHKPLFILLQHTSRRMESCVILAMPLCLSAFITTLLLCTSTRDASHLFCGGFSLPDHKHERLSTSLMVPLPNTKTEKKFYQSVPSRRRFQNFS